MKKILLTIGLSLFTIVMIAQISAREKQALIDFYKATNGEKWTNSWNLDAPVSNWHGVTIKNNAVTEISLFFNNIEGTIPATIGAFSELEKLELSFNKISGTIPTEIGNLKNLKILAFNGNNLTGDLPGSIGNLTMLEELHVSSNDFYGVIPQSIGNLNNLKILNVFDNQLTGTIPENLLYNNNLKQIIISGNDFRDIEKFSSLLLFNDLQKFKDQTIVPSAKTTIATESSDDEN
jgi:Leucine-rich repeat (LRR) protein